MIIYPDVNSEESYNILFRIESFYIDLEIMSFSLNNGKEASLPSILIILIISESFVGVLKTRHSLSYT
jgi:hypothetical protein